MAETNNVNGPGPFLLTTTEDILRLAEQVARLKLGINQIHTKLFGAKITGPAELAPGNPSITVEPEGYVFKMEAGIKQLQKEVRELESSLKDISIIF